MKSDEKYSDTFEKFSENMIKSTHTRKVESINKSIDSGTGDKIKVEQT
jgi:hypothetical protein